MQRKEVKAVLFDMDGVLVDSLDAWHLVFNDTLEHFGLKTLSNKEFKKGFGSPIEHDMKKYYRKKSIKEVVDTYNKSFNKRIRYVKLNRHSLKILQFLKNEKIKTGLLTNSTRQITFLVLGHFKLKGYFDVIMTMESVKRRKPAPDMVLKACKMLKVSPRNTILVGDSKNDIIAGKRAGCVTVGYGIMGDYRINKLLNVNKFI